MVRRTLALILALTAFTIGLPQAAQAETLVRRDAHTDVFKWRFGVRHWVPAPDETRADIRRLRIRHTPHGVNVRVRFANLTRVNAASLDIRMLIRTSEGAFRQMNLLTLPENPGGFHEFVKRNFARVPCGVTHHVDYTNAVMAVHMPRRCFGHPRWVQVTLFSEFSYGSQLFGDNAHADTRPLWRNPWSRRIHRG